MQYMIEAFIDIGCAVVVFYSMMIETRKRYNLYFIFYIMLCAGIGFTFDRAIKGYITDIKQEQCKK